MILKHQLLGDVELKIVTYSVSLRDRVLVVDIEGAPPMSTVTLRLEGEEFERFYVGGFSSDEDLELYCVEKLKQAGWKGVEDIEASPSYLPDFSVNDKSS